MSGTKFKQGDILIVPFPFSDLSSVKQRPVVVLSKSSDNDSSDDIITCGITSHLKDSKHSVLIENSNLEEGTIPFRSRIRVDKLFTIEKSIVKKKVGRLDRKTFDSVRKTFFNLI